MINVHVLKDDICRVSICESDIVKVHYGGDIIVIGGDIYTGEYEIVPKTTQQTFDTKNKMMIDDVIVFSIPYHEVANPSGGYTATIGG